MKALALGAAALLGGPDAESAAAARGLAWLDAHVVPEASWLELPPERSTAIGKRVVALAVLAWAERARADRAADRENLAKVDALVRSRVVGAGPGDGSYASWIDGFAALAALEDGLAGDVDRAFLERITAGFARRQNAEGGWDHGERFGISFYPTTLIAATNLALLALGVAEHLGVPIDRDVARRGLRTCVDVQGENGAMPYGAHGYLKGYEAGRTCGTAIALAAFGGHASDAFARARRFVTTNVERVPRGHASSSMHVFLGSLAFAVFGPEGRETYRTAILSRVLASQRDDGSIACIEPGGPDEMELLGDELTNRAYVTALSCAALLAPRSRLAAHLGAAREPAFDLAPREPTTPRERTTPREHTTPRERTTPRGRTSTRDRNTPRERIVPSSSADAAEIEPSLRIPVASARAAVPLAAGVAIVRADGTVALHDRGDGRVLAEGTRVAIDGEIDVRATNDGVVAWTRAYSDVVDVGGGVSAPARASRARARDRARVSEH